MRATLRSWIDGRLSRGLTIRLLLVLLIALAALSLAVVLVAERARSVAAERYAEEVATSLDKRIRAVQSGWLSQADVLRAQIHFARVLDLPDAVQRNAALSAYFATLGGEGTFTHAALADAGDGRVLWRYRTRSQQDLVLPKGAQALAWSFGELDATLYRAIAQRVLVAGQPARLWLFVPLDRGLVAANVSSGVEVDVRWQAAN